MVVLRCRRCGERIESENDGNPRAFIESALDDGWRWTRMGWFCPICVEEVGLWRK